MRWCLNAAMRLHETKMTLGTVQKLLIFIHPIVHNTPAHTLSFKYSYSTTIVCVNSTDVCWLSESCSPTLSAVRLSSLTFCCYLSLSLSPLFLLFPRHLFLSSLSPIFFSAVFSNLCLLYLFADRQERHSQPAEDSTHSHWLPINQSESTTAKRSRFHSGEEANVAIEP